MPRRPPLSAARSPAINARPEQPPDLDFIHAQQANDARDHAPRPGGPASSGWSRGAADLARRLRGRSRASLSAAQRAGSRRGLERQGGLGAAAARTESGGIGGALLGTGGEDWARARPLLTGACRRAARGDYRFASPLADPELAALACLAGCYRFGRYKSGG